MKKHSLRFQMTLILLGMMVIMIILGHVLYTYFINEYSARLLEMNANMTVQLTESIQDQYGALREALNSFSVDTTVNRFLSTDSDYEKLTLMPMYESLLQSYKKMNPSLYSIVLKRRDGSIFSDPTGSSAINIAHTAPAFLALEQAGAEENVLILSGGGAYIALRRDIYQNGAIRKKIGSCLFVIDAGAMTRVLKSLDIGNHESLILYRDGTVMAGNSGLPTGARLPESYGGYLPASSEQEEQTVDREFIAVSQRVPDSGFTVLCITGKDAVFSELNGIRLTTFLLLGLMLLLVSGMYLIQWLSLSQAFRRFLVHIDAIAGGRKVPPLRLRSFSEFEQLSEAFNRMIQQLEELNANNLEYHEKLLRQDLENKQSQLLALQSQINPHFLYNTLECINSAGAVCGSRDVEEMSTALAFIFRYAIKGGHVVRLRDELETLQAYISIQQIRFPDMFCVEYEIPAELEECRMLKFLLQPIAENSILHGFRNQKGPFLLRIGAWKEGPALVISVQDNGEGIPEEELIRLRQRLSHPEEDQESIGLMNIQRRIRLYYGKDFGIEVESEAAKGTRITARLPLQEEAAEKGEAHV